MLKYLDSEFCLSSVLYLKAKLCVQKSNSNLKNTISKGQEHSILNRNLRSGKNCLIMSYYTNNKPETTPF